MCFALLRKAPPGEITWWPEVDDVAIRISTAPVVAYPCNVQRDYAPICAVSQSVTGISSPSTAVAVFADSFRGCLIYLPRVACLVLTATTLAQLVKNPKYKLSARIADPETDLGLRITNGHYYTF